MDEQPEITAEVRRWTQKAEYDLRNAEYVLTLKKDCPSDTIYVHCQQVVEKYLKALLVSCGVLFPKTHDLFVLPNLVPSGCGPILRVEDMQPLNRYSVEAR